jgi:hypothetical protein
LYLFVDSTREISDKNIELIVSLTSLSRWYDTLSNESGAPIGSTTQTTTEKGGRGAGVSTDKAPADVSPARGLGSRQRTSTFDMMPQTPGPHAGQHDGNIAESNFHRKNSFFYV